MKKSILLLAVISVSISAKADWGSAYHIRITIETTDGKISKGYALISVLDTNKIENAEYLKQELYPQLGEGSFYRNRIKYKCQIYEDVKKKDTVYYLTNKINIPLLKDIKMIKIDEIIAYSPFISISGEFQLSDTVWMKTEPVRKVSAYGYLCNCHIHVHCNSTKTDDIIKQIKLKQKEIDNILGDNVDMDTEFREILKKFKGEKVVIISVCTD
jgi:hypothetical protein